jgi:hypothetical protein
MNTIQLRYFANLFETPGVTDEQIDLYVANS